jgi:hypothetical protein
MYKFSPNTLVFLSISVNVKTKTYKTIISAVAFIVVNMVPQVLGVREWN